MSKKLLFLISFVLVLALANGASAQDANHISWWTNAGPDSNLWSDANNWWTADWNDIDDTFVKSAANSVPTADAIALIGQGADWFPYPNGVSAVGPIGNCRLDSNAVCYQLYIGADPCDTNQPSHLEMTGGSLTIRTYEYDWTSIFIAWNTGSTGSMTIHDGNVSMREIWDPPDSTAGGHLSIGGYEDGVGTFTMLGGTVTCYHFDCPDAWTGEEDMEGYFNLYGGTLYTYGDEEWMEFWLGMEGLSPNSLMDIRGGKAIMVSPDEEQLDYINDWIAEGKIIAYGGDPNLRAEIYADYDITNPGKTTLQAVATEPNQAWNPQPRPGSTVDYRPTLSWTPGDNADSHVVYFSTDRAAVVNSTAPNTPTGANSLAAGTLDWTTNYYWQVEEVSGSHPSSPWPGLVWDFKTTDHLTVDDMESYGPPAIRDIWKDYFADTKAGNHAQVKVEVTDPVRGGGQSMDFAYRCSIKKQNKYMGSWLEASTADLKIGSDWVTGSPKALVLHFYGSTGNGLDHDYSITQDQMYVELVDGSANSGIVKYPYDMNDVKVEEWQEFNVDLADPTLAAVDLNNVVTMYIGFGGQEKTGQSTYGAGYVSGKYDTVWFDDIGLYPPRCVPREGLATDITDDCITNYQDIEILGRDWLMTDALVSPSAPPKAPLAFYQFEEGAGPTVDNLGSLDSAADGTLSAAPNTPTWVCPTCGIGNTDPCVPHERCMQFDGLNDYVGIPDFNSIIEGGLTSNTMTITAWIKRNGTQSWWTGLVFCTRDDGTWGGSVSIFGLTLGDGTGEDWFGCDSNTLQHVAYHWDSRPDGEEVGWMFCPTPSLYVPDGEWIFCATVVTPEYGTVYMSDGTTLYSEVNYDTHLKTTFTEPWSIGRDPRGQWEWEDAWWEPPGRAFKGRIDDVRIYDYSLTRGQISFLAGVIEDVYFPLPSPANLLPKDPCDSADPNLGTDAFDPNNIDVIDFRDFLVIANDWLEGPILWP